MEANLVERCARGDARAWDGFVRTFSGRLLNMAYRYTGNYSVAEELAQEVFLKIYENLRSFRPESGSLQSWVMRVGRNLVIDYYRAHKRERNVAGSEELELLDFGDTSEHSSPFDSTYQAEKAHLIHRGLEYLSAELKEAVILRDLEGMAYQEIADLLEIPEGTVKSRINRGRIELAKALQSLKSERLS